jgi:hypothetical protein
MTARDMERRLLELQEDWRKQWSHRIREEYRQLHTRWMEMKR